MAREENPWFELRRSRIQGRGAFAKRRIRKGTRIIEYTGEIITDEEADRRYDDEKMDRHHTFLFAVDVNHVIDGARRGNDARFINHSCDPNCEAVEYDGRIFIEALKNIKKGEELVYDYHFILEEPHNAANKKLYPCNCGSKKCRGTILAKKR